MRREDVPDELVAVEPRAELNLVEPELEEVAGELEEVGRVAGGVLPRGEEDVVEVDDLGVSI